MTDRPAHNTTVHVDRLDELVKLVRQCGQSGQAMVDYGVAHGGLGHPPPAGHVRLIQYGGVIEHYERDFVVRVAAGAALGDVQAAMASRGQFLPIEAEEDISIGEIINHNVYGPLCVRFGAMRDLLLGLRYVDGQARDVHVGGRVIKNVAGYDLTRLMIGSLGQLGVIYEATMQTYAIPRCVMSVDLSIEDPVAIDHGMPLWLVTDAAPSWLCLHRQANRWIGQLGFFGRGSSCDVQLRQLETLLQQMAGVHILGASHTTLATVRAQGSAYRRWRRIAAAMVKIIVPPAVTGQTCRKLVEQFGPYPLLSIDALPSRGCIWVGGALDALEAMELDQLITPLLTAVGGVRVWHARPTDGETIAPFGPSQADWPMLEKIKAAMDPRDIFNPGRFLPAQEPAAV